MRRVMRALYGLILAAAGVSALGLGASLVFGDFSFEVRTLGVLVFGSSWLIYRFGYPLGVRLFGPAPA